MLKDKQLSMQVIIVTLRSVVISFTYTMNITNMLYKTGN